MCIATKSRIKLNRHVPNERKKTHKLIVSIEHWQIERMVVSQTENITICKQSGTVFHYLFKWNAPWRIWITTLLHQICVNERKDFITEANNLLLNFCVASFQKKTSGCRAMEGKTKLWSFIWTSTKKRRIVVTILGFVFAGVITSKRLTTSKQQHNFSSHLNMSSRCYCCWSLFVVLLFWLVVIALWCSFLSLFFSTDFLFSHTIIQWLFF